MNRRPIVFAVDGGLTHLGWCRAVVDLESDIVEVSDMGLIETHRAPAVGDGISVSRDNMRRARELADALAVPLLVRGSSGRPGSVEDPATSPVDWFVTEAMSHAPSASSAAKLALALGVVACWSELIGALVAEVTPQEIKKAMGVKEPGRHEQRGALDNAKGQGRVAVAALKKASKLAVQEAVRERLLRETGRDVLDFLGLVPKGKREHPCDALAALYTAVERGRFGARRLSP